MLFPIVVSASSRRPPLGTVRYVTYLTHLERVRNVAMEWSTGFRNAVARESSHVNYLTQLAALSGTYLVRHMEMFVGL